MAGDWLKVEKDTPNKPEIFALASALGISRAEAFYRCFLVWCWADSQCSDGYVQRVTNESIDDISGMPGLGDALSDVGWLQVRSGSLQLPNFDRHMGQSAKTRALTAKRMAKSRSGNSEISDDRVTLPTSPEKRREEKRREKEDPPLPPVLDTEQFRESWDRWKTHRKEIRKPLKPTTMAAQLKQLSVWGLARAVAALEFSIANGWTGIFEPGVPKDTPKRFETVAEKIARLSKCNSQNSQNGQLGTQLSSASPSNPS